jgi:hypothetical protein
LRTALRWQVKQSPDFSHTGARRGRLSPDDRWHRRCWSKSARCSPSPSQTASWPRPRGRRRRNDVGGRIIIIGNIRGEPLANHVGGEQTLNIGKACQIAQIVAPSPGPAVSSVTSAHDVTRQGSAPTRAYYFKLKIMTCKIQSDSSPASLCATMKPIGEHLPLLGRCCRGPDALDVGLALRACHARRLRR